jgi:hypothetical protein
MESSAKSAVRLDAEARCVITQEIWVDGQPSEAVAARSSFKAAKV